MTESYPLYWPEGWPRTTWEQRSYSRFEPRGFAAEAQKLYDELRLLGARNAVLSSNIELRRDGLPYSNRRSPDDPGVAVYFTLKDRQQCIPCDRWYTVEENCRAVWKSIEALRGLDRWGARDFVDAAFRGFEALPAPGGSNWRDILGHDVVTFEDAKAKYHRLARQRHPDATGGSNAAMSDLNEAYEAAERALGHGDTEK